MSAKTLPTQEQLDINHFDFAPAAVGPNIFFPFYTLQGKCQPRLAVQIDMLKQRALWPEHYLLALLAQRNVQIAFLEKVGFEVRI